MLRLDTSFNADLPESKRWLKEYGARENEAFRMYPVPKTEKERRKALESSTKFLVVRHPMDRLVSSYLDKVCILVVHSYFCCQFDHYLYLSICLGCWYKQGTQLVETQGRQEFHPGECWQDSGAGNCSDLLWVHRLCSQGDTWSSESTWLERCHDMEVLLLEMSSLRCQVRCHHEVGDTYRGWEVDY